jgi:hypothetical protein
VSECERALRALNTVATTTPFHQKPPPLSPKMTKLTISHVLDHTYDVSIQLHESGGFHFTRGHHTVNVNLHEVAHDEHAPHGHHAFDLTFSSPGLVAADLIYATYRHLEVPQQALPFEINGPNQTIRVYARPHTNDHCISRIRLDDAHEKKGHH